MVWNALTVVVLVGASFAAGVKHQPFFLTASLIVGVVWIIWLSKSTYRQGWEAGQNGKRLTISW